jgi:AcrR family transcriptional regulator
MRNKDEQKEQLILDTALQMINRVGLAGLKMSDLAKEARLATGTLYIYFKDKETLLKQLYLYLVRKTTPSIEGDLDSKKKSTKLKIKTLCYDYLQNNLLYPEYNVFFEQYFRSPFHSETEDVLAVENQLLAHIYQLISEGQAKKKIKNIDAELLMTMVCGMLNEVAKLKIYTNKKVEEQEWETIFEIIWDAIKVV